MDVIKDTSISYLVELALNSVVSCLQNVVGSSSDQKDDLEKIKSSLKTIRSVIESAEEHPVKDQLLIDWLEKLKDAAYDAEDILDEYATRDLIRRNVEAENINSVRDPFTNKVRKIASSISIYPVLNRTKMNSKLKEIRERLEYIEEESQKFKLSKRVRKWEREFKKQRQTLSLVDESEVYGRHEDKGKIVDLLLLPVAGHEDEDVSVIPIVGMGGLGKTTLAQLVFNDDQVRNHFELKMWVCVSDDFDVRSLIEKVVRIATGNYSAAVSADLNELQERVGRALNGRRFLLVLDDVWNEEREKWNRLRVLLMCGGRGSRIVVTTRDPRIASIMSKIEPHHLERLSQGDCWKLFANRAFSDDREGDHPKLVEIGKDIVSKCRGVPLAVITLGSLLSFKREESEWVYVRESEFWNLADADNVHGILPALRLSYYHLNPILRQCFTFCAIFPKDYQMAKELLIQLWMANGCIPSKTGMELEDIGIGILNELLMRSLFQEVKKEEEDDHNDYEDRSRIKVHDLVHDLAQSVMGNDCCILESGKSVNISKRVRHLYFHGTNASMTPSDSLFATRSLRTLLRLPSETLMTRDLPIFKFLRALDLRFSNPPSEPTSSLGELIHLRYLRLTNASNQTLPDISSLQNLQTLKLFDCFSLRELPKGTTNLINLRCLDIKGCPNLSYMPANIGKLSCLRKLPIFVVGNSASVCSGIEELRRLNLRGYLRIERLERVEIPSDAQRANLIGKPNLDYLELVWNHTDDVGDDDALKIEAEEELLNGLQPHGNLKGLKIFSYGGIHFPTWMTTGSLLPNIVNIVLYKCTRCQLLPPLGQLPSLKYLVIAHMYSVENIGSEFYGNDMSEGFPSLERLEILEMRSLKVWLGLHHNRMFPSLQILLIHGCSNLTSLPEWIGNILPLKVLSLGYLGLTSLPEGLQRLTGLHELFIVNCREMRRRCEATGEDFHKIKHIPDVYVNGIRVQRPVV